MVKKLNKTANSQVDHERLLPGLYVSRRSRVNGQSGHEFVTTLDLRFYKPNDGYYMNQPGLHTIEHLGDKFLREYSELNETVVYFGPMGCRTGFTLILSGWHTVEPNSKIVAAVKDMLRFILDYDGDIPRASPKECGNYREHSLWLAKLYTADYLSVLENNPCFMYPVFEEGGKK